jgi:hypothetical protein
MYYINFHESVGANPLALSSRLSLIALVTDTLPYIMNRAQWDPDPETKTTFFYQCQILTKIRLIFFVIEKKAIKKKMGFLFLVGICHASFVKLITFKHNFCLQRLVPFFAFSLAKQLSPETASPVITGVFACFVR